MKFYFYCVLFFVGINFAIGQVKIGEQPNLISASSILELDSPDKVFVMTRVTSEEMIAITPLNGALVYNTDEECFFYFDGVVWQNLCQKALDFQEISFDTTTNVLTLSNGASVNLSSITSGVLADNGLTKFNNTIEMGGTLIKPTIIATSPINTLALEGLQESVSETDEILVAEAITGVIKKQSISSVIHQEQQVIVTATDGQNQFTTPSEITDANKIDVYRNGVRIDFTILNTTTLEVEPEAICFEGDKIRIVQLK